MSASDVIQAHYREQAKEERLNVARKLYSLTLHEEMKDGGWDIWRVPGGWIYGAARGYVFVPYDNSFTPPSDTPLSEIPF